MQNALYGAAVFFIVIKLASTFYLVRHRDRAQHITSDAVGRIAYVASKLSPILLVLALLAQALLAGRPAQATGYVLLLGVVIVAVAVAVVVYLRRKGLWFGLAHTMGRKNKDADTDA